MAVAQEKDIRKWLEASQMALHMAKDPRERCVLEGKIIAYKRVLIEGTLKCIPGKETISLKG